MIEVAWIPAMKRGGRVLEREHDGSSSKPLYGKNKKKSEN